MNEQTELLREIRDLLLVIAEPALAKRDEGRRIALREIVGQGKKNTKAILLMDGIRSRVQIQKDSGIDASQLSRLIKSLRNRGMIAADDPPKLVITVPSNFFENSEN